jgi:3-deoxy-manno-octulosonate cytidylyltransferase (CMP-KDO synthetase)
MIVHVCDRASAASTVCRVIVATDDERIFDAVVKHGYEARMTSPDHASGTDRVAEVAETLDCDLIVNVQGDEPLIDPSVIDAAVAPMLAETCLPMSTTREPIENVADILNPNVVKVVTDSGGLALYFSRSPIPFPRAALPPGVQIDSELLETAVKAQPEILGHYYKHTGLYVYRRKFLLKFAKLSPTDLERQEALEQLRALQNGYKIKVVTVSHRSIGIDTAQDFERARVILERMAKE